MPFVKGNSGVVTEVDEGVLVGILRDPDVHQVNADGKKIAEPKNDVTEVVDGFARPNGALAPFDTVTQPPVVTNNPETGQPEKIVVETTIPVAEGAKETKASASPKTGK